MDFSFNGYNFSTLGIIYNLIPFHFAKLIFVVFISVISVYLSERSPVGNLGFSLQFLMTCYMAIEPYGNKNIYEWPLKITLGAIIYAGFSYLWGYLENIDRSRIEPIKFESKMQAY